MAPAFTVSLLWELVTLKSEPTPERFTVCGLPWALSLIVRLPLRLPEAVGANVTSIVQLELAAKLVGQLLTWAKSPVIWSVPTVKGALPVFLRITACAAERGRPSQSR